MADPMIPPPGMTTDAAVESRCIRRALLPCLVFTLLMGLLSDGVHHDDDLTHFLIARWVRWFPQYLLHIWGRPGLTLPLGAVAWLDDKAVAWHACRALSALVTAGGALIAARIALRLGIRHAWLVVVACYLQPMNTLLAATTLTENFLALYLAASVLLLLRGQAIAASVVFSLVLVSRHEALILLPVWWAALLARPRPPSSLPAPQKNGLTGFIDRRLVFAIALSIWAPLIHNVSFRLVFGRWPVEIFFTPNGSTAYPAAGPFAYILPMLLAFSPALAGLAIVGAATMTNRRYWFIPALTAVYVGVHWLIVTTGFFGSGGFARFMVAVAPLAAILAVAGWQRLTSLAQADSAGAGHWLIMAAVWALGLVAFEQQRAAGRVGFSLHWVWAIRILAAVVVALLAGSLGLRQLRHRRWIVGMVVATTLVPLVLIVRPLTLRSEQKAVVELVDWLWAEGLANQPIFAANPWFAYALDLVENPRAYKGPALLASMPEGTVVIWDSIYSGSDYHRLRAERLSDDPHYELLNAVHVSGEASFEMRVYRKIGETPPPAVEELPYPPELAASRDPVRGIYYLRARETGPD